jgi:hypothetical protein
MAMANTVASHRRRESQVPRRRGKVIGNGRKRQAGRRPAGGDDALILELASSSTVRVAAERAGVGERTVYRRLDDPAFRRRVSEARGELFSAAMCRLAAVATKNSRL